MKDALTPLEAALRRSVPSNLWDDRPGLPGLGTSFAALRATMADAKALKAAAASGGAGEPSQPGGPQPNPSNPGGGGLTPAP